MPQTISDRYTVAIGQLKAIAAGTLIISEKTKTEAPAGRIQVSTPARQFGQKQLGDYMRGTFRTGSGPFPGGIGEGGL